MKQKELSILLRAVVVLCGVVWLFFLYWFGKEFILSLIEPDWDQPVCLLRFLLLIPVLISMVDAWRILARIGKNNSFCVENAKGLRRISFCALTDTVLVIVWGLYAYFHDSEPFAYGSEWFYVLLLVVAVIGVTATAAAAALSHLTLKAADLQDENDLTI